MRFTLPLQPRLKKAPLVLHAGAGVWNRHLSGYRADVQALASMGFAVLQVNHRGSEGFGRAYQEAIREDFDRIPLGDVVAAMDWVAARHPVNPKLTALFGIELGGYLSLRALQLYPERFRCAIVMNPVTDVAMWLNYAGNSPREEALRRFFKRVSPPLKTLSVVRAPEPIRQPVLVMQSGFEPQSELLRRALAAGGRDPQVLDVTNDFSTAAAKARAFAEIEAFLNTNIYNYATELGETEVVE